jgi:hypothetical protein
MPISLFPSRERVGVRGAFCEIDVYHPHPLASLATLSRRGREIA